MTGSQHLVLLVGSPKGKGGSSGSLGEYILGKISQDGITKETHHVGKALKNEGAWNRLVDAVDDADIIILSFPTYWDSLPAHLIRALERIYIYRNEVEPGKVQTFYVIVNNGFPEPWHNEIAIDICQHFAKEARFKWGGALNIGGGAAIGGKPLEETGGMTLRLRETLDMAAQAIGKGEPIPNEVEKRLVKPLYPPWFILLFGGHNWRRQAKQKGAKDPIHARPYER